MLVPLPAWVYLLTVGTVALVTLVNKPGRAAADDKTDRRRSRMSQVILGPADAGAIKHRPRVRNGVVGVYYVLVALAAALQSVETARLAQSGQGAGLAPFVLGGCAAAGVLRATKGFGNGVPGWQSASQLFWLLGGLVAVLKVVAVGRLLVFPNGRFARRDTAYPTQTQLAIQVALFVVYMLLLGVETVVQFFRPGYRSTLTKLKEVQVSERQQGIELMN